MARHVVRPAQFRSLLFGWVRSVLSFFACGMRTSRPVQVLLWAGLGLALLSYDYLFHVLPGAVEYSSDRALCFGLPCWTFGIPVYTGAGVLFYALYAAIVGLPVRTPSQSVSVLGGLPVSLPDFLYYLVNFGLMYAVTGAFSSWHVYTHPWLPYFPTPILVVNLVRELARIRQKLFVRAAVFVAVVSVLGPAFEWINVTHWGWFVHRACPRSVACFGGAAIPLGWLPLLFATAAVAAVGWMGAMRPPPGSATTKAKLM